MQGQAPDKGVAGADGGPARAAKRPRPPDPAQRAAQALAGLLPQGALALLPRAWTRLGRVLVLDLAPELEPWRREVAWAYAEALGCEAVVRDVAAIAGAHREPVRELLWGASAETVHTEGGVRFALDATKVMWSKGNVHERQRIPRLVAQGETVVDLFAGIGYFAVPVAAKAGARVVACELNPEAFRWLRRNVALNGVEGLVEARLGDCREVAPRGMADRVLLGYTVDTERFLPVAIAALKLAGGVVHYHEACPAHLWEERPRARVEHAAREAGRLATLQSQRVVKNYAPGMVHVVVDAEVR